MTNDYYEVFQKRSQRFGKNFKEYATENAKRNFRRVLLSSPNAVDIKLNDEEDSIKVLTLSNTDKDVKDVREFCIDKEVEAKVGDFIRWGDSSWLIFNKEIDTVEAYDKFEALYCQYKLRWIDDSKQLHEVNAYITSSASSTIRLLFNSTGTIKDPADNMYLMAITKATDIPAGQRFIVAGRAWGLIENDSVSVPGICYLSLTEDKLKVNDDGDNNIDDVKNEIADSNGYSEIKPEDLPDVIELKVGESYTFDLDLDNDRFLVEDSTIVELTEKTVKGLVGGETTLTINIKLNKKGTAATVKKVITIKVADIQATPIMKIINEFKGPETVKIGGRKAEYSLHRYIDGVEDTSAIISNLTYEDIDGLCTWKVEADKIVLTTNNKNKIGKVKIIGIINGETETREIQIKNLWG